MSAIGIDIGGTKIETQVFDAAWAKMASQRVATPGDYPALVQAIADQIHWARTHGPDAPVGIGSAGLVNPVSGLAHTANLPATGKPLIRDIQAAAGQKVHYINDCSALTLSESRFGAAADAHIVVGLILGTGVGGGVSVGGRLIEGPAAIGGEFGHIAAPARVVHAHGLPVVACGCGRLGCIETLIAGPGLTRIAEHITGQPLSPQDIAQRRGTDPQLARIWAIWCDLVAELLLSITFTVDPQVVVLGGGLSRIPDLCDDLHEALSAVQLKGFAVPDIRLAQGGDASGARGAAYHASTEAARHV